jgi:hypothetical protein
MADIQAEGLRAAGEVVERVLGSEPAAGAQAPRADYGAVVDAWAEVFRRSVAALTFPGALTVAVDAHAPGPVVRARVPGRVEVWLHNETTKGAGPLSLWCDGLRDGDGEALAGVTLAFEPETVEAMPARSGRAVTLVVDGQPARPGRYRGVIQARGAPAVWLPLEITC